MVQVSLVLVNLPKTLTVTSSSAVPTMFLAVHLYVPLSRAVALSTVRVLVSVRNVLFPEACTSCAISSEDSSTL